MRRYQVDDVRRHSHRFVHRASYFRRYSFRLRRVAYLGRNHQSLRPAAHIRRAECNHASSPHPRYTPSDFLYFMRI